MGTLNECDEYTEYRALSVGNVWVKICEKRWLPHNILGSSGTPFSNYSDVTCCTIAASATKDERWVPIFFN